MNTRSGREPEGFADFVRARGGSLHRTAMLLTQDDAAAQDLVHTALARAWPKWGNAQQPEAYVRRIMMNEFITDRRRTWSGELTTEQLPDRGAPDDTEQVVARDGLIRALATLPHQQRAVLVLRYFHDYTERQTAEVLGISVGTVKSHASRALTSLRIAPQLSLAPEGGRR